MNKQKISLLDYEHKVSTTFNLLIDFFFPILKILRILSFLLSIQKIKELRQNFQTLH
jgi:hypothetical protein